MLPLLQVPDGKNKTLSSCPIGQSRQGQESSSWANKRIMVNQAKNQEPSEDW